MFIVKLNGLRLPKESREGEEERSEVETRALLSGPLFFFTNHQAQSRERERKSLGERRRHQQWRRGNTWSQQPTSWRQQQQLWLQPSPSYAVDTQLHTHPRACSCHTLTRAKTRTCTHTHTHTLKHRTARCLRSRRLRSRSLLWWLSLACRRCWRRWWLTTGLFSVPGWRSSTPPVRRPTLASGGSARRAFS